MTETLKFVYFMFLFLSMFLVTKATDYTSQYRYRVTDGKLSIIIIHSSF